MRHDKNERYSAEDMMNFPELRQAAETEVQARDAHAEECGDEQQRQTENARGAARGRERIARRPFAPSDKNREEGNANEQKICRAEVRVHSLNR